MAETPVSLIGELSPDYTCLNQSDNHTIQHLIKGNLPIVIISKILDLKPSLISLQKRHEHAQNAVQILI